MEKFFFFCEAFSVPFLKLLPSLNGEHYARTAIFQVAIGRASARRRDISSIVFPQEAFQIHYVNASDAFFHVAIWSFGNVFVNHKHVVIQLHPECALCNQGGLMKLWRHDNGNRNNDHDYTEVYTHLFLPSVKGGLFAVFDRRFLVHELTTLDQVLQLCWNLCQPNIHECEVLVEGFGQSPSLQSRAGVSQVHEYVNSTLRIGAIEHYLSSPVPLLFLK